MKKNVKKWSLIGGIFAVFTIAVGLFGTNLLQTSIVGVPSEDNYFVLKTDQDVYDISATGAIDEIVFSVDIPENSSQTPMIRALRVVFTNLPDYVTAESTSVYKDDSGNSWNVTGSDSIRDSKYIALIDDNIATNIIDDTPIFNMQFNVVEQGAYPATNVNYAVELTDGDYGMHTIANGTLIIGNAHNTNIHGVCGDENNKTYSASDTTWSSSNFCEVGTVNPQSPSFPDAGGSTTWTCMPEGGTAQNCSAARNGQSSNNFIPQNVVATASVYSSNIFVRWDPVDTSRLEGYNVYRAEKSTCQETGTVTDINLCSPVKVGETSGAVVYIDTTSQEEITYVYAVSSIVGGNESEKSDPSNEVTAGKNGVGKISADYIIFPYSSENSLHLTVSGLSGDVTWSSSKPDLVSVDQDGNISVAQTAIPEGGVAFITVSDGSNDYGSMVVVVWPRGDTDGNFLVGAVDQNNVAVGWSE